ncbi:MAG: S41 family peptidase [Bacteroidetes bacterium]|nr:S41 family peptidase [Bacteroidota bacterium]
MKYIPLRFKIPIIIACTALVSVMSYSFVEEYFEVSKNLDIFTTLFREVNIHYVDPVDPGKLMKKGIDNMLQTLDPYTNYIPESDIEDYRFMTTGQYGGIGAVVRQKDEYIMIGEPYEGFPADKSGLMAGDIILEIDGNSTKGKKVDDVSHLLKGSPNTKVKILIQRMGIDRPEEKELTREEIKVKSVPYYGMLNNDIAYIKLNSFTESASREVGNALRELKSKNSVKGLVFDLRGNPGGLLNEAVNISNLFVSKGQEIVETRGRHKDGDRTYLAINDAVDTLIPLAVLVNSGSASASEIVSGSLQDLDRGVIIGQRTFGKGLVQTTRQLSYNSQLKITVAKYYIPSGRCIQALDYTHRNEDGSVGKIPDSLVSTFKTKAGRKVMDGGGVLPDVTTEARKMSAIASSLVSKYVIFDFATQYRLAHPNIDAKSFKLSDSEFNDFLAFIGNKEYDYTTKSEKTLEDLKKNCEDEKYFADLKGEYEALKAKLSHNKQEDVQKNKEEIVNLIEDEITSRYFYQSGRIRESLTHDTDVARALEVLGDSKVYNSLLSN